MNTSGIIAAITPLAVAFDQLAVDYHIGGSVASSVHGILRATFDVDIVAYIRQRHVKSLVKQLEAEYYIDEDMIRDAIKHRSSFNVIYLANMLKIDIFIPKLRPFDREESYRAREEALVEGTRLFFLASPEGTILHKLEWYRMGGEASVPQWNDVLGILKVRGTSLDLAYLQQWAKALNVSDLLERAFIDAGLNEPQ